jgi:5-methyltetrahydrofolate--homocysteine methyltransferase
VPVTAGVDRARWAYEIHLAYFRAGADIVPTNTFSSIGIAQADYGIPGHCVLVISTVRRFLPQDFYVSEKNSFR